MIAKDILRHHAVYWPAMLMSAGLPPPRQIFCHGYLTVKGQKISKSITTTKIDPNAIADELGVDPLRYFVLREYTLGADGDFTYEALFQRYESDLGNDLGNLLNRTISMAHKFVGGKVDGCNPYQEQIDPIKKVIEDAWEAFSPGRGAVSNLVDRSRRESLHRRAEALGPREEARGPARASRRPRAPARDAALGGADGRARDAERRRGRSCASWVASRTREPGPTSGAGRAAS